MDSLQKINEEIKNGSFFHAYLLICFSDDEVVKVISTFADKLNLFDYDIIEVVPIDESGKKGEIKIELIKNALHQVNLTSLNYKICVIKRCNRLNATSANALLKILEEGPKKVIFLLSSENEQVMPTIRSRCRVYKNNPAQNHTFSYDQVLTGELYQAFAVIDQVAKAGEEKEFLNWAGSNCQKGLNEKRSLNGAELIIFIERIRKRLNNNINLRLNLENLVLKLRQNNE